MTLNLNHEFKKNLYFKYAIIVFVFLILFLPLKSFSSPVSKYAPFVISGIYLTDQEYFSLPDFLQVKVRYHIGGSPEHSMFEKKIGPDFQHYHHWAAALVKFKRAMNSTSEIFRSDLLKQALGEYSYLLRNCSLNNPFRYAFHLSRGEIYYILGEYSDAAKELQMSLMYNDKHMQTYIVLLNAYERLKMKEQAVELESKIKNLKN